MSISTIFQFHLYFFALIKSKLAIFRKQELQNLIESTHKDEFNLSDYHRRSWHGPPPFFLTFCLQIYFQ